MKGKERKEGISSRSDEDALTMNLDELLSFPKDSRRGVRSFIEH